MVEDNREDIRTPENIIGDRLDAVREITEPRRQNNVGVLPFLILLVLLSRNNFWFGGCGFNNFN